MKCTWSAIAVLTVSVMSLGPIEVHADQPTPPQPQRPARGEARTAGEREAAEPQRPALTGIYAHMARELNFTPEQVTRLEALVKERQEALAKWDEQHGDALRAIREAHAKARQANDREAAQQARERGRALTQQRAELEESYREKLHAIMTPQQKQHWAGWGMYTGIARRLNRVELTDAQREQIKQMCIETAGRMEAAKEDADKQALRNALHQKILSDVLTAEQREKLATPARQSPQRGGEGGERREPAPDGEARRGTDDAEQTPARRRGRATPPQAEDPPDSGEPDM